MAVKTKAALKAQLQSADRDDIGKDLVDSLIGVDRLKFYSFTGRNGAGAITLTGAAVGDVVIGVAGISTVGNAAASFEGTITVVNQIQQSSASNLSAVTYTVLLAPAL
jgi:aspartate 1-decarboxylase